MALYALFERRRCRCSRGLQKMLILIFAVLLSWPNLSSLSAESLALVRGLEWCHYHLKTCHFQSALFLIDSQSNLALLFTAPAFSYQSPSGIFWTSWLPIFPRSSKFTLGLLDFPATNWQTRSPKPEQHSSSPIKDKAYLLYDLETKFFSQFPCLPDSFGVLRGTGHFSVSLAVKYPDFAATVTAFFCPLIYVG